MILLIEGHLCCFTRYTKGEMDPQVGTSFIPKKPLVGGASSRGGFGGLVMLLALLLFLLSLLGGGGAFAYERFLKASIGAKAASLERAQEAYSPSVIQDLMRLDSRLKEASGLLQKHVAPSAILFFLESVTLEKIQFTSFEYELQADGSAKITLKGIGDNFSTVALQSDEFGASKMLRDVVFSDISIEKGDVSFTVSATVNSPFLLYSKSLTEKQSSP